MKFIHLVVFCTVILVFSSCLRENPEPVQGPNQFIQHGEITTIDSVFVLSSPFSNFSNLYFLSEGINITETPIQILGAGKYNLLQLNSGGELKAGFYEFSFLTNTGFEIQGGQVAFEYSANPLICNCVGFNNAIMSVGREEDIYTINYVLVLFDGQKVEGSYQGEIKYLEF